MIGDHLGTIDGSRTHCTRFCTARTKSVNNIPRKLSPRCCLFVAQSVPPMCFLWGFWGLLSVYVIENADLYMSELFWQITEAGL